MKTCFNKMKIQLFKLIFGMLLVCMGMMIPQDVQAVEFLYTADGVWEFVVENGTATICNYSHPQGESWDVVIPKTVTSGGMTYTVAKLNAYVFKNDVSLTSVVIPNTVKYISQETFHNCNAMTSVTFEEGSQLETIGDYAFGTCRSLTRIEIPASVVTLGKSAFDSCNLLESVTFEEGSRLETIGNGAFNSCKIREAKLPLSLKTIGSSAFHGSLLTSIEIPASVTSIGSSAFEASASLTSVTFAQGSSCKTIGDQAFYGVPITSIEIPASVETIEAQAFNRCQALTSITFAEGSKLTTIGEKAFYYSTALTEFTLPSSVTTIENSAFEGCTALTTFTIPKNSRLETIGDGAFSGVTKVKEIYFPPTLKTIGTNAFRFSHVEQFELPSGLTTIGDEAFTGNDEDVIVIPPSVTTIGTGAFSSNNNLDVFYYPEELADQVEVVLKREYYKGAYGEYTVSDTNPPVVTITYTGTVPSDVEVPAVIPGIEDAQIQVGNITAPQSVFSAGCGTKLLSELSGQLPSGYSFKEPSTELVAGEDKVCQVSCTSNGQTYTFNTTIKVAAHNENKTVLVTKEIDILPTCTEDGAGHTECEVCHAVVNVNLAVPATGHLHTALINSKSATCQGAGYTGDTKCTDCGQTIQKGNSIAMIPHTWDAGVVTKQATYAEQGIKTYTCTACKLQRTEPVAKKNAGAKVTDAKTKAVYKVKSVTASGGTVTYVKSTNKKAKEIKIPATVKIDGIVFKVTAIEKNAFKKHKYLKKVTIGSNVKTIGANAFYNCTKLKTVSLGKNVTTIGDKAFYKCTALTKITIPSKVKKISKAAFYGCKKLKSVTIKTTKLTSSKVGSKAFKGIKSTATIKVPKKKYSAYKKLLKKKGVSAKAKYKKF
ncbi:MAG: leucine-rich repeat domain-containing protein [Lachnospiraceae bacterium]|nr:leucine-rich repeat domain-containing protein [Lachnospiraceae bacterium]